APRVRVGEEPVTGRASAGNPGPLVLEGAGLGGREVRELVLERLTDGADGQPRPRWCLCGRHQRWRNVSRYLPIWSSSPSLSSAVSTRSRLTNVPFRLPWSSSCQWSPSCVNTACLRDTVTSSRKIAHSGER